MQTPLMLCESMAIAFNSATERVYWKAYRSGTIDRPLVVFKSRSSMVSVTYDPRDNTFQVKFNKTQCVFGDYVASTFQALGQITGALKATGFDFESPVSGGTLRLEFNPLTRAVVAHIANAGDAWLSAVPAKL